MDRNRNIVLGMLVVLLVVSSIYPRVAEYYAIKDTGTGLTAEQQSGFQVMPVIPHAAEWVTPPLWVFMLVAFSLAGFLFSAMQTSTTYRKTRGGMFAAPWSWITLFCILMVFSRLLELLTWAGGDLTLARIRYFVDVIAVGVLAYAVNIQRKLVE